VATFTFETDWASGKGAIDRSQRLSQAIAAATHTLMNSVAQDAGGGETPGSLSEHVVSLRDASEDLALAFENMAQQIAGMEQRNILIRVSNQGAKTRSTTEAVTALQAAAEGARHLSALIAHAQAPLLDLTLTDEAESMVWDQYQ
jgi:NAD dependent epimerase/dehydratase family enzyme